MIDQIASRRNRQNRLGRIVEQKWQTGGGTVKGRYSYGYDRNSNRLWRKNWQVSDKDEYYGYDGLNRLTKFNRGTLAGDPPSIADPNAVLNQAWPELEALGNWRQFKWDPNGGADSWTTQDRTHNKVNETLTVSGTGADWPDPNYDPAGNMISGPQAAGDPNTRLHFVYDAWNRLVAVKDDVDGAPHDYVAVYRYNGLHQRVRKFVGFDPDSGPWYDYYYNPSWQLLEVRDSEDPHPLDQYLWGANYIDAAVVRWHDGNLDGDLDDQGDNTLYFTYDGNFNVTGLVKTDGGVAERYAYDPYGQVTVLNGASGAEKDSGVSEWSADADNASDWGNEVLYCGYRREGETGLYHVRNRYYHPRLGRWMSRDPMGNGQGRSLYDYAGSEPIRQYDPTGLFFISGCSCEGRTQPPPRSDATCCNAARDAGYNHDEENQPILGILVCCDGRHVGCAFYDKTGEPSKDIAVDIAIDCTTVHETVHKDSGNVKACPKKCPHLAPAQPTYVGGSIEEAQNECSAYLEGLRCLRRRKDDCARAPEPQKCYELLSEYMKRVCQRVNFECGVAGPIGGWNPKSRDDFELFKWAGSAGCE